MTDEHFYLSRSSVISLWLYIFQKNWIFFFSTELGAQSGLKATMIELSIMNTNLYISNLCFKNYYQTPISQKPKDSEILR